MGAADILIDKSVALCAVLKPPESASSTASSRSTAIASTPDQF